MLDPLAEKLCAVTTASWLDGEARYRGETALAMSRSPATPSSEGDHVDHCSVVVVDFPLVAIAIATAIAPSAIPTSAAVTARNFSECGEPERLRDPRRLELVAAAGSRASAVWSSLDRSRRSSSFTPGATCCHP